MTTTWFLGGLAVIMLGGVLALLAGTRARLASTFAAVGVGLGSLAGLVAALSALLGGAPARVEAGWAVPGGRFALSLDPLAAAFLVPLFVLAPLCAVYGVGYLAPAGQARRLGPHWFFYCSLVAMMAMVMAAAEALLFLMAWELMTITSFFLVAFEHRRREVARAAWLYLLAGHLAGACLLGMFLLAGHWSGSLSFAQFGALASLRTQPALVLFALALAGFGLKAGLFPLHVWLPDAHPAAPSHVSALMSGVMVKTGIYGVLRVLTWLPPPPPAWGMALALLGLAGALYAVALAIVQDDIKRALAYSTVENVGLVFIGLGLGLWANATGRPEVAALGFAGALLHAWNHSLFKGLLFLAAGAVAHGAGTRSLDRMGGLLRRMPVTGALLVGGCLALTALPPLNGLVGEWLLYLGLLRAGSTASGFTALMPLLIAGGLAVTGALALVAFTRLSGAALLGQARGAGASHAHEAPRVMLAPMIPLLAGCVLIGAWPRPAVNALWRVIEMLAPGASPAALDAGRELGGVAGVAWLLVAVGGLIGLGLAAAARRRPVVREATWGCGYASPGPRMAYTASGYAELAQQHLMPGWLRPEVRLSGPRGLFPRVARLWQRSLDPILHRFFEPLAHRLGDRAVRLRWLQQGRLPIYLLYMFVTCVVLVVWSLFTSGDWSPL
jgi:formate hydrogenlyase subunit 3/multisubunit Na+/H+ antiporter MnhD subunit